MTVNETLKNRDRLMVNAMSIDVEDYYQVSNFESIVKFEDWENYESRVINNVFKILNILDNESVKATFFILGWIAEKYPSVVKAISACGHEIATHGYAHRLIYKQTPKEFTSDLKRSIEVIEDIAGEKVLGHRAASFSIVRDSLWAVEIMKELGLKYDSSIFPIINGRYGIPDAPRSPYQIIYGFWEFPMTTVRLWKTNLPIAGGAYFRVYPYWLTSWGISKVNSEGKPAVIYLHPWELDPDQPRLKASITSSFRHYTNLHKTETRLKRLIRDFHFAPIKEVLGL